MPKVSIIVPVCNMTNSEKPCIKSIIGQSLKDIEVIFVVYDTSKESVEFLKTCMKNDGRLMLVDQSDGKGYGNGMNKGLNIASGEYVGFVRLEDLIDPDMYRDLYILAKKNDLDFVKADYYQISTNKSQKHVLQIHKHLTSASEYNIVTDPYEKPYVACASSGICSGIYRREFIEKNHIRYGDVVGEALWEHAFNWQATVFAKRCMFLDKPYYRQRKKTFLFTADKKQQVYHVNIEYDYICDILMAKENEKLWEHYKSYYNADRFQQYVLTSVSIDNKFKREYIERISKEFRRAFNLGEIDISVFTPENQKKLRLLIKSPYTYYQKYALYPEMNPGNRIKCQINITKEMLKLLTVRMKKVFLYLTHSKSVRK